MSREKKAAREEEKSLLSFFATPSKATEDEYYNFDTRSNASIISGMIACAHPRSRSCR